MIKKNGKWWLAVALCCLAPMAYADRDHHHRCDPYSRRDCQQAPEGGSTSIYLLAAGLTCFGAMFLRSRLAKPSQS